MDVFPGLAIFFPPLGRIGNFLRYKKRPLRRFEECFAFFPSQDAISYKIKKTGTEIPVYKLLVSPFFFCFHELPRRHAIDALKFPYKA